ncbi:hypothetical protein DRQ12_01780 [candidate division KSB1 bacterium]|nr:RecX family transcriptional regulator [bacterium]RKY80201.1 MAG: hypothetical protein DRQ12_01780 [candidate division KSB1 bacterium]HDI52003.1 hypothetical protein [Bacteroidota bacterium]
MTGSPNSMLKKVITKLEVQKGHKSRVSVFLEGEFAFGVDRSVALGWHLQEGKELSSEEIEQIQVAEERRKAKERAFRWLAYRNRSRKELEDKLKRAGFTPATCVWVLEELERLRLIDDQAFAESFARDRILRHPVGKRQLGYELSQKGINADLITATLEKVYSEEDEISLARKLAKKKFDAQRNQPPEKAKKRVADFLLRRGFDWDTISTVLQECGNW